MTTFKEFLAEAKDIKQMSDEALLGHMVSLTGKEETARVRFNKNRSVRNGNSYKKAREEAGAARNEVRSRGLNEGKAGVVVAQSKKTQAKLRADGSMEKPGWYHKKGGDWEDTTVVKPKKKKK